MSRVSPTERPNPTPSNEKRPPRAIASVKAESCNCLKSFNGLSACPESCNGFGTMRPIFRITMEPRASKRESEHTEQWQHFPIGQKARVRYQNRCDLNFVGLNQG